MEILKERILADGKVFPGNVLKVDSFLNHQIDMQLVKAIGQEFCTLFQNDGVTKVLTIEASGIVVAAQAALELSVPMLFAKKVQTKNIANNVYTAKVMSYTHSREYDIFVAKEYLSPRDRVLVLDDFLANGQALEGLIALVKSAGATLVGCGTVIEKGFQGGGDRLRAAGVRVESLAIVDAMDDNSLSFR